MIQELRELYEEYKNWCEAKGLIMQKDSIELFIRWILTGKI